MLYRGSKVVLGSPVFDGLGQMPLQLVWMPGECLAIVLFHSTLGKNGIPMPRSPRISVIQLRYSNMKGNLGTGSCTTRGICISEKVLPTLYSSLSRCIYFYVSVYAP